MLETSLTGIRDCAHLKATLAALFGKQSAEITLLHYDTEFEQFALLQSLDSLPSSRGKLRVLFGQPPRSPDVVSDGADRQKLQELTKVLAELKALDEVLVAEILQIEAEMEDELAGERVRTA